MPRQPSRLLDRHPVPPIELEDHVSRRDAARLLGFASDFKVRQLEKQGRLIPVRGAMGQAWYPRAQVVHLCDLGSRGRDGNHQGKTEIGANTGRPRILRSTLGARPSDAALIAYLRAAGSAAAAASGQRGGTVGQASSGPTVVDLVAETGVSIARAERVFRFWLAHDQHPAAIRARATRGRASHQAPSQPVGERQGGPAVDIDRGSENPEKGASDERRTVSRLRRDALIGQLRHGDPRVRQAAFRELQGLRKTGRTVLSSGKTTDKTTDRE